MTDLGDNESGDLNLESRTVLSFLSLFFRFPALLSSRLSSKVINVSFGPMLEENAKHFIVCNINKERRRSTCKNKKDKNMYPHK